MTKEDRKYWDGSDFSFRLALRVEEVLINAGAAEVITEIDLSGLSSSEYLNVYWYNEDGDHIGDFSVRIANHVLPPTYGRLNGNATYEVSPSKRAEHAETMFTGIKEFVKHLRDVYK